MKGVFPPMLLLYRMNSWCKRILEEAIRRIIEGILIMFETLHFTGAFQFFTRRRFCLRKLHSEHLNLPHNAKCLFSFLDMCWGNGPTTFAVS